MPVVRVSLLCSILALLSGCASLPALSSPPCEIASTTAMTSATIDVLTYNVEGLPWPARSGRAPLLQKIGARLAMLHATGRAPDVVLFQEAFSPAAVRGVVASGYPALASGPGRTERSRLGDGVRLPGRARLAKGELGIRLMTSGLVIASRWPILSTRRAAYSRRACAGFDCLSNKGVVLARLAVPGVPDPIAVATTHMNARKASKVAPARHLAAHRAQGRELSAFLAAEHDPAEPLILGGDFNMRRSPERFTAFVLRHPFGLVHDICPRRPGCTVAASWDGDAPWMDTQDLQFFASGARVRVEPVRAEAMFDGSPDSPKLSDHDGFRVTYRLSWPAGLMRSFRCGAD